MRLPFGYELGKTKALPLPQSRFQSTFGVDATFNTNQTFQQIVKEGFYQNAAIQGCIAAYTMTLNEPPCTVLVNGERNDNHPLFRLLQKPNPSMSGARLWSFVASYIAIGGNCYVVKVRNAAGAVVQLYPYHDGQIKPVPSQYEWVDHYEHNVDGRRTFIPASDVAHFMSHIIDPLNPHKGMSPILAAARSADIYSEMERMVFSMLKNDAIPRGVLSYPQGAAINDATTENIRNMFAERVGGANRGRLAVLSDGATYSRVSFDLKELQADNIISKAEVSICQAFRVHPLVAMTYAGLQSSTYSNMEEAFKQFTILTRVPIWNAWEETLELAFGSEFAGIDIEFDLSNVQALQSPPKDILYQSIAAYEKGILTQNEARVVLGQSAIDTGDRFSFEVNPMGAAPIQGLKEYEELEQKKKSDAIDDPSLAWLTKEDHELQLKKYQGVVKKHEAKIAAAFADVAAELEGTITSRYKLGAILIKAAFDVDAWKQKFIDGTNAAREALIREVLHLSLTDVGVPLSEFAGDFDGVLKLAAKESSDMIAESVGTIRDELRLLISSNANTSGKELGDLIKTKFEVIKTSRAEMIGRTTATSTTGATQKTTFDKLNEKQPNPKQKIVRVWITRTDGDVRPEHAALNRQPESKNGTWNLAGTQVRYAGDPAAGASQVCNCRCVATPTRAGNL